MVSTVTARASPTRRRGTRKVPFAPRRLQRREATSSTPLATSRIPAWSARTASSSHKWDQRGAYPHSFREFLQGRSWEAATLARLLGCTAEEAAAVLGVYGFAYEEGEGLWHPQGDDAARLLDVITMEAVRDLHEDEDPARQLEEFRERVETLLRTGEPPPEPVYDYSYDVAAAENWQRKQRLRTGLVAGGIAADGAAFGFLLGRGGRR